MSTPSRQIGWGPQENLLWQISKQLEALGCQVCGINSGLSSVKLYGSFYDTTTQSATINVSTPVKFNTVDISNGVNVSLDQSNNPTIISVEKVGVYNFQFSSQFHKGTGGLHKVGMWFRKNGLDIPWSNGYLSISSSDHYHLLSWNFIISLSPNDNIQLIWNQDDDINMVSVAPGAYPGVPSVILTVTQVN